MHALLKGQGPAMMLFHASPMNASSLTPLIELLSEQYTVIALDTPGYGRSECPSIQPTHMREYVQIVEEFRQRLGLQKLALYGTATGGQIAIRYAIEHPDRIDQIYLDNVAHFSDEMADQVINEYFPDLSPQLDGAHLDVVWDMVTHLFKFFPWCWKEEKYALSNPQPPVSVLHMVAMMYLKCGDTYDWAYRAAFAHEKHEYITQLTIPATIFRWDLSIVKPYTDKIFELGRLPQEVKGYRIKADEDRYQTIAAFIKKTYEGDSIDSIAISQEPLSMDKSASDVSFPDPEPTGQYLRYAWKEHQSKNQDLNVEALSQSFINWAASR